MKVGFAFGGNVNNLNSQMLVKEELHQLLAPVKANRWASELGRIAVFWCERSQIMARVGFEPTPPLEDQNTQIIPPLLSLNQLMILSLAPLTTRPFWHLCKYCFPFADSFKQYCQCVEWFFICLSIEKWEACSDEYVKSNSWWPI